MGFESIPTTVGLFIVKTIAATYTVVTLPLYYLYQKPWRAIKLANVPKAKQIDPKDPSSPWVRTIPGPDHFIKNCLTADEVFVMSVEKYTSNRCMGFRPILKHHKTEVGGKVNIRYELGDYQWSTYTQINERVDNVLKGLISIGVKTKETVVIFSETRMEWMITAQAIFRMGASIATLYATLGEAGVIHGINEVEANVVVASSSLVRKLVKHSAKLPTMKKIVYFDNNQSENPLDTVPDGLSIISLSDLEERGSYSGDDFKGTPPTEDDTAVIMYTSGSTGTPKGVIITHKNITSFMKNFALTSSMFRKNDLYLGVLPLAHIAEFVCEVTMMFLGNPVAYSSPLTLTDNSPGIMTGTKGDANLIKPTIMFTVPLLLEKIRKNVLQGLDAKGPFAKGLILYALDYKRYWAKKGYQTPIIDRLVCQKFRASLGGNFHLFLCGASTLSLEAENFIKYGFNMKIIQGYGLTEITCVATLQHEDDLDSGVVGYPSPGVQVRLVDWPEGGYRATDKPNPRGEVVVAGDVVTKGYFKNEGQTKEAYIEENGVTWFYSGDIAEVTPKGMFKIIDRKKDLVKLQHGEYVALGKVEAVLKNCNYVDNICVHGSSLQTNPLALVSPNRLLLKQVADKMKKDIQGNDLLKDNDITSFVTKAIGDCGHSLGLQRTEIPNKVILCDEEWTPESGLVTAALKLRRKEIYNFYQKRIDAAYDEINNN